MCELIRKSGQLAMELSFSSRVMAQGVNAVVSEVPMPQFTATLRNLLRFPPDVTAPETTCVLMMLHCWTITSECACCFLFAVVFCMPILGESDK